MSYQQTSKAGVGVGTAGLVLSLLVTLLLFTVPDSLSPADSAAYIETWSRPVIVVADVVFQVGLPSACAVFAYRFTSRGHPAGDVVVGFVVGGLVLGVGSVLLGVVQPTLVGGPAFSPSFVSAVFDVVGAGGRLVAGAFVGIVGAHVVADR
jgi:hypothetical protein